MGDFNAPDICWDSPSATDSYDNFSCRLVEFMRQNALIQHITQPTRFRGKDTPHTLDLVFTNNLLPVINCTSMPPLGASDHCVLLLNVPRVPRVTTVRPKYSYDKGNYSEFTDYLDRDWTDIFQNCQNDVNLMWISFKKTVIDALPHYVPKSKPINMKKKRIHPFNKDLHECIKMKRRTWTRYMETRDPLIYEKYKMLRNKVKSSSRIIKNKCQNEIALLSKHNPKVFWKYVNSKTKNTSTVPDLKVLSDDGSTAVKSGDMEKAEALSTFFSSVYTHEPSTPLSNTLVIVCSQPMQKMTINIEDVLLRLNKINVTKSPGPDEIHPRILHEARSVVATPLKIIFDASINQGMVPQDWKIANITAIHKKDLNQMLVIIDL